MSSADPELRSTDPVEAVTPTPVRRGKRRTRLELPRRTAHPRAAAHALARTTDDGEAAPIDEDEGSDHELSMVSPHRVAGAGALLALLKADAETASSDKLDSVPLPANKENLNPNLAGTRSFKRRVTNPSLSSINTAHPVVTTVSAPRRPLAARQPTEPVPPVPSGRPNRRRSREVANADDAVPDFESAGPSTQQALSKEPTPPKRHKGSRPVVDEALAPPPTPLDVIVTTRSASQASRSVNLSSALSEVHVPSPPSRTVSADSLFSRLSASGSPTIPSRPGAHLSSVSPAPSYTVLDDFLVRSRAKFSNGNNLSTPTLGPQPSDLFGRAPSFAVPQRTSSGVSLAPTELLSPRWNAQESASIHANGLHSLPVVPSQGAHRASGRSSKPKSFGTNLRNRVKVRTVPNSVLVRADVQRVLTYCFP